MTRHSYLPAAGRDFFFPLYVLKPDGEFHLADFEGPGDHKQGFITRLLLSHAHLKENSAANIIALMKAAGFADAAKVGRRSKLFGCVAYHVRP